MKWLLLVIISAFVSCKKEFVCECNRVRPKEGPGATSVDGSYIFKGSRSSAETSCTELEGNGIDENGEYVRDCEIQQ